jgi:hypothetical protein
MYREEIHFGHNVKLQVDVIEETKGYIFFRKVKTLVLRRCT